MVVLLNMLVALIFDILSYGALELGSLYGEMVSVNMSGEGEGKW